MKHSIIYDDNGRDFTSAAIGSDVEFVNPIEHYKEIYIQHFTQVTRITLILEKAFMASLLQPSYFKALSEAEWDKQFQNINANSIHQNFFNLLGCESKHEQERLLKGQSMDTYQFTSFIFRAFTERGYTFSSYSYEHLPAGTNKLELPQIIKADENGVYKAGYTELTDGQLKNVVNHRKVVVSKFLDKQDEWHCFFVTYNSLAGKENWQNGQPHYHYLSDKWGLSRQEAVSRLKSNNYPKTSVHIKFTDSGLS